MTEGTEDTGQISVAELLKRNGQQVESRGGRRRRGVKGGISVAELTGEIPVFRDASENRNLAEPGTKAEPEARTESEPSAKSAQTPAPAPYAQTPPAAARPGQASSASASSAQTASAQTPSAPAPSAPASAPSTEAWNAASAYDDEDDSDYDEDDEPIASRPQLRPRTSGRSEASTPTGTSRDRAGSWVTRSAPTSRPNPAAQAPAPTKPSGPASTPTSSASVVSRPTASEPSLLSGSGPNRELIHRNRPATPARPAPSTAPVSDAEQTEVTGTPVKASPDSDAPQGRAASRAAAKAEASGRKLSLRDRLAARTKSAEQADEEVEEPKVAPSAVAPSAPPRQATAGARPVGDTEDRNDSDHDADHDRDTDSGSEADEKSSTVREWAVLIGQGVVAVIAGALLFKGFEKLWDMLPWVALVLALLVIVGLVAMVRILRRTDDITSFVIAVVVGMIVTLGPLAFMLASG